LWLGKGVVLLGGKGGVYCGVWVVADGLAGVCGSRILEFFFKSKNFPILPGSQKIIPQKNEVGYDRQA
jgi:hypothetical protein